MSEQKSAFDEYEDELGEGKAIAITHNGELGVGIQSLDDVTGFTDEQKVQLATFYTAQIKVSSFQMALALYAMKKLELYRYLKFETFNDYAKIECGLSRERANELVEAIDDYGSGEKIKQLLDASPVKFLQVSKEIRKKKFNGEKLILSTGEEVSATEYLEERVSEELAELRKKNKALNRELENSKSDVADAQGKIKTLKEKVKTKESEVETLKESKSIDPLRLQSIKEQRELERVIDDQNNEITKALKNLTEIPEEARNNSLGIYLMRTIAIMEIQLKALKMDWGSFIIQESK